MSKKNKILNKVANDKYLVEMLYDNLLDNFHKVSDHILGDKYYNMGMDVYSTHEMTCNDIMDTYDDMKKDRDSWRKLAITSTICWVIVSILALIYAFCK